MTLPDTNSPTPLRLSRKERSEAGRALRDACPRSSHALWQPPADRLDVVGVLNRSAEGRIPELVPIRHGRMMRSPFTFFRGAAMSMAADLATTPVTGLRVQACGDAHLCNFGGFATPERRVILDINDLDETLPAPWEWDIKRLAASFVLASRANGHSEAQAREAALTCVQSYRMAMNKFGEMRVLDVWYSSLDLEKVLEEMDDPDLRKRIRKRLEKARDRSVLEHDFPELVTMTGGEPLIKDNPPLLYHPFEKGHQGFDDIVRSAFAAYRESMPEHRRVLLDRYTLVDIALKVVGIGSVGSYCAVMLLMADDDDPLFLQVKEARASVLEPFTGRSVYANHAERVVKGQFLMQAASDLFLGWTEGRHGRHFYIRQLRDMKIKPLVEIFTPSDMIRYAELCGWILARAHARSGDPAAISGYLGKSDKFDEAIATFSFAYADQTEQDHAALVAAVRAGVVDVILEGE